MLKNKRILITGSAGSIGSELVRQLIKNDNQICAVDINETDLFDMHEELNWKGYKNIRSFIGDVRDKNTFKRVRDKFGYPEYIFHCAALKHVTPSQWMPDEYVKTNIFGTLNTLYFSQSSKAKMVNISTDKVVDAVSIMGATKRVAELAVKAAGQVSVRFGNVMGSRGSVLEIWQKQMDRKEPLTITDKRMKRYMMTIPEAAELIIRASEIGQPGQIIILNMGEQISIVDLAEKILKEKRIDVGLKVIGRRAGEKLEEVLMSEDEKKRAKEIEFFWVIPPEWKDETVIKKGGEKNEKN